MKRDVHLKFALLIILVAFLSTMLVESTPSKRVDQPLRERQIDFPLAKVITLPSPCPSGVGMIPRTTCLHLRVTDPLHIPIDAEVRVTEHSPEAQFKGTIVVGSGGPGTTFYSDNSNGLLVVFKLSNSGFRVIERRWTQGWFNTAPEIREQSRRYATLLTWIHDNLHTTGVFFATGNSGGAAEIAYSLTTWSRDSILDGAILTSGPTLSRLDYLCTNPPSSAWSSQCSALAPPNMLCGAPLCAIPSPATHFLCPQIIGFPVNQVEQSILHSNAVLHFPTTKIRTLLGTNDCTVGIPQARLFHNAVTSEKLGIFVTGAPHFLPDSFEGRQAIIDTVLSLVP